MGAILLHLRDPIGALMAARSVCADRLVATTRVIDGDDDDTPRMQLMPPWAEWWFPNVSCYRRWLEDAGFGAVDVSGSVTLTAEVSVPSTDIPGQVRNAHQRLRLADAHVKPPVVG